MTHKPTPAQMNVLTAVDDPNREIVFLGYKGIHIVTWDARRLKIIDRKVVTRQWRILSQAGLVYANSIGMGLTDTGRAAVGREAARQARRRAEQSAEPVEWTAYSPAEC